MKAEPVEDVGNSARRKAVLIALAGFGIFSLGDGFTKSTAGLWPGTAVAALRFSMGAVGLSLILLLREEVAGFAMPRPLVHIARGAAMAVSTACFFMAVQVMPLATATTIGFTAPLMTAVLSALFLRERVPLRIWMTIGVALAGVALVLRPSLSGMGWHPVLPLGAALAMAILMMLNRVAADSTPDLLSQVLVAALASPILIGFALIFHLLGGPTFHIGPLSWAVIWRAGMVAAIATAGHWLIYRATRGASAARIAPANYVQLPIAITVGWIVFCDWPDWLDIAGIVLIIAAGTMLFRSPEIRR